MGEPEVEVQDDSREAIVAAHCGLQRPKKRRGRVSLPDAHDDSNHPFELKSATRTGVTTARDVGLHTVKEWRKRYWVFAIGSNLRAGFQLAELYVAHPNDLEFFFSTTERRLRRDWALCNPVLRAAANAGIAAEKLKRVKYFLQRGITINNPKIPLAGIRRAGTPLDPASTAKARRQLRQFVRCNPLKR